MYNTTLLSTIPILNNIITDIRSFVGRFAFTLLCVCEYYVP